MSFSHSIGRGVRGSSVLALALLTGCLTGGGNDPTASEPEHVGNNVPSMPPDGNLFGDDPEAIHCDPSLSVKSDGRALVVQDPEVLAHFTLERVLTQLIALSGDTTKTPIELVRRLFDTENTAAGGVFADNLHCDSPDNLAFANGAPTDCPRAEGGLAASPGLFVPGHPDYFAPVALVNRFDLAPSNLTTCGEFRIVFAKWSGRTDPKDRLFLIFEGALTSPTPDLMACQPVARLWAGLEQQKDTSVIASRLEAFYFTGLPGWKPLVHPDHFGLFSNELDAYSTQRGQVRVSQRMEDPWEMREFHLTTGKSPADNVPGPLGFQPVTVKNNPRPELFDPAATSDVAIQFQTQFAWTQVAGLAAPSAAGIRMAIPNMFSGGESALGGAAQPDYVGHAQSGAGSDPFFFGIEEQLYSKRAPSACPPGDPLTPQAIVARATTQTCGGCHAPENFLGAERKLGCGVVWPKSLGGAHIDEAGKLSPALTEMLLPHRAAVMTTYLQACDINAIQKNLQPSMDAGIPK